MASNQRIIVYVDGFNFYYGLKDKNWKKFYWLDIVGFFSSLIRPHQELVEVKYFSARSMSKEQSKRQDSLFVANKLNPRFSLHLGKYIQKSVKCSSCYGYFKTFEEKETDVRIATQMIGDVINGRCDISILVSADSDLVPPIDFIREYKPGHKVFVYFPPNKFSSNLHSLADGIRKLDSDFKVFQKNVFPDEVLLPSGYILKRPEDWI